MKVIVYPADVYGCGHYRLIYPATVLADMGHDVQIVLPGENTGISGVLTGDELQSAALSVDADVVVFQRPTNIVLSQAVHILRAQGTAVIVDMDDDLSRIHPSNPAWQHLHPDNDENNWQHAARACRDATLVTVSTEALKRRYAGHGRVAILPNLIPELALDAAREPRQKSVGWGGAVHSHPDDLRVASGAITSLTRSGYPFHVVGPPDDIPAVTGVQQFSATGVVDLEQWYEELARLCVGIAPLADTSFNESKSWLKPLEYAAAGVPCVVSPRSEYAKLAEQIPSVWLANKPREWIAKLNRLLKDDALRKELGVVGRNKAAELTYERHAPVWWRAWAKASQLEHHSLLATDD